MPLPSVLHLMCCLYLSIILQHSFQMLFLSSICTTVFLPNGTPQKQMASTKNVLLVQKTPQKITDFFSVSKIRDRNVQKLMSVTHTNLFLPNGASQKNILTKLALLVGTHTHMCPLMHAHTRTYTLIYVCVCVCVCVCVHTCICAYIGMYVRMYVSMCTHTHTHHHQPTHMCVCVYVFFIFLTE
jgi:hypothetical protein